MVHCQGSMHEAVLCSAEGLHRGQRTDCEVTARHEGALQAVLCSARTCNEIFRQIRPACSVEAQAKAALVCLQLQSTSASKALAFTGPVKPDTRLL